MHELNSYNVQQFVAYQCYYIELAYWLTVWNSVNSKLILQA